ncbi:FtsK/SpoIIIE domain-containing protein [Nocardia aurantia]|uniref:FtsK domain-containing protein n=1 Tax=Nocardia aurantia TaxID=2585199 RepID=A0A7K0DH51_9NOCA|nr:FtsK/SpoIIIE domain-containing protein [Nocardia aurantia]MQY24602.1 hypothetical protein [Nocardia aurantia]
MNEVGEVLFLLVGKLLVGLLVVAWWAVLYPMFSLPVAAAVALGWWQGWPYGVAAGVAVVGCWVVWRVRWPVSFERWVTGRIRQRYWKWFRYSSRWIKVMAMNRLTAELDTKVITPYLFSARIGRVVDVLEVGLPYGQKVETWEARSEELRHSFRAVGVRVRHAVSGRVRLEVIHTDILRKPIPLPRTVVDARSVDLEAVPIGMTQLGNPWRVALLGTHVMVAGATGSGKGSVVWSVIAGLGPRIAEGSAVVFLLDPKAGVEFGAGMDWFDKFAYDNGKGALELLRETARVMIRRMNRMRRASRKLIPSVKEPLIVLIVDEFASLTEYFSDKRIRDEIQRLLGLILTMARAAGVVVIGCLQDPSKEVMRLRQLFPTRVGLRLSEATQVAMVFGPTGRDRGALCDLIPHTTPGVGYVQITPGVDTEAIGDNESEEQVAEIERVRAYYVTDDDIRWIMATYPRPRRYTGDQVPGGAAPVDLDEHLYPEGRDGKGKGYNE